MTVKEKAKEALQWVEGAVRATNATRFIRLKANRPEWVFRLAMIAHNGLLPDDWRYEMIDNCLGELAECEDEEAAASSVVENCIPIETHRLIDWLGSGGGRIGYCNEVYSYSEDVNSMLAAGFCLELEEVLGLVKAELERLIEEEKDEKAS